MSSAKRRGGMTVLFENPPSVAGYASVVGKKEGLGPLAAEFDIINNDTTFGEPTWEKSESRMQMSALSRALQKAEVAPDKLNYLFAGDLLNQCISSSYASRNTGVPFFGLYGACSTMSESLTLAAMMVDGGFAEYTAAVTSSHFCSAERQFRYPLEYGSVRTPTAQWTVTGAGAVILSSQGNGPYVRAATTGCIRDLGVTDTNNMGAAMAPAAYETIKAFFIDTGSSPNQYDLIVTGDLGRLGREMTADLLAEDGYPVTDRYADCGLLIYAPNDKEVGCGGSGCGCSASVLCSYLLNSMKAGKLSDLLFVATGALMSPVSTGQGESIPGIAHLVHISSKRS